MEEKIILKPFMLDDIPYMLKWRKDKTSQKAWFEEEKRSLSEYTEWIEKQKNVYFYIGWVGTERIGVIRINDNNRVEIGINVAPDKRGLGYGSKLLFEGIKIAESYKKEVIAYISSDNNASIRLFEKCGFVEFCKGYKLPRKF